MRQAVKLMFTMLVMIAGCSSVNNPVSPISDTLQLDNLQVTLSIPKESFGSQDTLVARTNVYNSKDDTVSFAIFNCNAITWSVQERSGKPTLSSPPGPDCNSLTMYSILPHQSQQIRQLTVMIPIVHLAGAQPAPSSYSLVASDYFGNFSLKFSVN